MRFSREEEIERREQLIKLIKQGATTEQISKKMDMSFGTIVRYRKKICMSQNNRELDMKNKTNTVPENFCSEWDKYARIVRNAFEAGRITNPIEIVKQTN